MPGKPKNSLELFLHANHEKFRMGPLSQCVWEAGASLDYKIPDSISCNLLLWRRTWNRLILIRQSNKKANFDEITF
jgi:hypothetical protein